MELHGGNVHKLARTKGGQQWWDFSANINPLGLPVSVQQALVEQLGCLTVYPDPEYIKLRQTLADYCAQPLAHILQGNGATDQVDRDLPLRAMFLNRVRNRNFQHRY